MKVQTGLTEVLESKLNLYRTVFIQYFLNTMCTKHLIYLADDGENFIGTSTNEGHHVFGCFKNSNKVLVRQKPRKMAFCPCEGFKFPYFNVKQVGMQS